MVRRVLKGSLLEPRWIDGLYAKCMSIPFLLVLVVGFCSTEPVRADVGVLLSDPTGEGSSRFTEAGHASIYLSNVCPASPIKVRLCAPGEQGSVISNYARLGENKSYEWNIIPLSLFLYGLEMPSDRPLVASLSLKRSLGELYRKKH